jgi:hypothetical protein
MTREQEKTLLAFLRKIEALRKHQLQAEALAKKKEVNAATRHDIDARMILMHIDKELPDMIKLCLFHQTKLDL